MSESATPVPVERPVRWPWLFVGLYGVLTGTGTVLVAANGESVVGQASYLVAFGMFTVVGALIVSRDRGNVIGRMLLGCAVIIAFSFWAGEMTTWLVESGRSGPFVVFVGLTNSLGWLFGLLPIVFFLPLLFPDGRPPSPRWRVYVWSVIGLLGTFALSLVFGQETLTGSGEVGVPNPFYLEATANLPSLDPLFGIVYPVLFALTVASLFMRFRRSEGTERQQIKWVAFGFLAALVLILFSTALGESVVSDLISGLGFLALPVSIGISVLRFHLYDLDVVVKKTVVYATLAIFATVVYLGLVLGLGTWLGRGSSFLTMLAAVVVAVTFQPARVRAQRLANRLVYGSRATPYEILSAFSERVGGAYGETDVLPRMARVLGEGIGAERSDVWLRVGRELRQVASWPGDAGAAAAEGLPAGAAPSIPGMDRTYPVEHAGEMLGALAVRKPPSDPISPADEKLIAGLASQAGLVLANVRLTEELKLRLEDLAAAQRRIVAAQDDERRRIERNIHDGAQQQLVALQVRQRLAAQFVDRDPERAKTLLEELQADTAQALEDLRDLARGIYPPLLADKGLPAALESQARKSALAVTIETNGTDRYPQAVEAAVYFSVLEALQNTAKYAEASQATVRLAHDGEALTFSVADDGRGFDPGTNGYGTGLQGIADRLAALGGSIRLTSAVGAGTTITGRIPVQATRGGA